MKNSWNGRTGRAHRRHRRKRLSGEGLRLRVYALLGLLALTVGLTDGAGQLRAAQAAERDVLAESRGTAAMLPALRNLHVLRWAEEARYNGMKAERDDLLRRWPSVVFDGFTEEQLAVAWALDGRQFSPGSD